MNTENMNTELTPRTDAHHLERLQHAAAHPKRETTEEKLDYVISAPISWVQFAKQLELELNAEKARFATLLELLGQRYNRAEVNEGDHGTARALKGIIEEARKIKNTP